MIVTTTNSCSADIRLLPVIQGQGHKNKEERSSIVDVDVKVEDDDRQKGGDEHGGGDEEETRDVATVFHHC